MQTPWHSTRNDEDYFQPDFQGRRVCGDLVIQWGEAFAREYDVESSVNGLNWRTVHTATAGHGGTETILLEPTDDRFLRIRCKAGLNGNGYSIRKIELKPRDENMTPPRYYEIAAERNPGAYPRWLTNQQAYWTIVGSPDDEQEGLFCEDGTIEPFKRGFSILPMLRASGRVITRCEAVVTQSLEHDYLPIPSARWVQDGLRLDIQLLAFGGSRQSLYARYAVTNNRPSPLRARLFLVFHPMQVYPPWQGGHNGLSPIRRIEHANGVVTINGERQVFLITPPSGFAAKGGTFPKMPVEGDIADDIVRDALPAAGRAEDAAGCASGAAFYDLDVPPGETRNTFVAIPLHSQAPVMKPGMEPEDADAVYGTMLEQTIAEWEARLRTVSLRVADRALVNTLRSYVAYNLVTKDGPGFQPGSWSYDKVWMRDGGCAASALLRMGFTREIREFLDWYAGWQLETGEVSPIIDTKHADPLWEEKQGLCEYDSQGQFVATIFDYFRFTGDRAFLEAKFPQIVRALKFLQELRERRATPEFRDGPPGKRIFYNLLPDSRSHEGYSPSAHSYWDDIWALKGWRDGAAIARLLGKDDLASWMDREYQLLRKGVYDSMRLVAELRRVSYVPGSAEHGDYDAAATAGAIVHCDELENLPRDLLLGTFDRFCAELERRLQPGADYMLTPYEMRVSPALLMMGRKNQALRQLRFMLAGRRPAAWNHLAEVIASRYRFPCYIGDMPHTWVGAEFIIAVRTLFLYEHGDELVLGAGIDPAWLEHEPVAFSLPSAFGKADFEMRRDGGTIRVRIAGDARPPAGFVLKSPLDKPPRSVTVNGACAHAGDAGVRFASLPAEMVLQY